MRDEIVAQEASIRVSLVLSTSGTVVGLGQWHYCEAQLITPPERYPRPCESRDFGEVDGVGRSGSACELESREADVAPRTLEEEVGDELHGVGEVANDLVFIIFNVTFVG